jgi:hypothetical protein
MFECLGVKPRGIIKILTFFGIIFGHLTILLFYDSIMKEKFRPPIMSLEERITMSNKDSRSGGKYSGNHTTLTPLAAMVSDVAHADRNVTRISPGFIRAGLHSVGGKRRVKIVDENGAVRLSVRDNTSHQEIHVWTSDKNRLLC